MLPRINNDAAFAKSIKSIREANARPWLKIKPTHRVPRDDFDAIKILRLRGSYSFYGQFRIHWVTVIFERFEMKGWIFEKCRVR